jgi:hypothetical protein
VGAVAQGSRLWRPEERAVIGDFRVITAVATTRRWMFAAGPGGLAVYDLQFHAWQVPVAISDGLPGDRVLVALGDPADESVWLGTTRGLVHYRPDIRQFDNLPATLGSVTGLMLDKSNPLRGIFLRDPSGWRFLARGGVIPESAGPLPALAQRVLPLSVNEAMAKAPAADAFRALNLTDTRFRTYRYTSAATVPITGELYFGTDGLGVIKFDPFTTRFDRLTFGLIAQGAGALAVVPGGVWVGTDARAERPGFTLVSEDLRDYRVEEGPTTATFGFRGVRALLWRARQLWAATDFGLWLVEPGSRASRRDAGLPDDNLFALAQGSRGVWVATALGLGFVPDSGPGRQVSGIHEPVLALSAASDSLWIGAASGLWFTWQGAADAYAPANVSADGAPAPPPVELRDAIVAVTRSADTVVAASVDRIIWRAPGRPWIVERVISPSIGTLFALQGDSSGVWIGGSRGLAFFRYRTRDFQLFNAAGDIPGAVHALAVSGPYLWVATEGGLVRFLKRSLLQ